MKKYKAVVIGCGQIGATWEESHAQAYRDFARTELIGMSDTSVNHLRTMGKKWKVAVDPSPISLCKNLQPDIVSLCTPDATHYLIAKEMLMQAPPKLLIVEKPVALSFDEAQDIKTLAHKAGCAVLVNYTRRFSPAFQQLKEEIKQGRHGRPKQARLIYGKGLVHNGSHAIDLFRFWLGEPVSAEGRPAAWGPEGDETYDCDLTFSNDCRVRLEAFDERVATMFDLDFLFEKSRWRFWAGGNKWEFSDAVSDPKKQGYTILQPNRRAEKEAAFKQPLKGCLLNLVKNGVGHLDGKEELLCSIDEGAADLKWIEKIRRAA